MQAIAAQLDSTQPFFVDVPEPRQPGPGQVLCRTLELGVCGTDREILKSARPWLPVGEEFLVLGHECLARVEAVGAEVEGWRPGDLAVPAVRRANAANGRRADLLPFGTFVERGIVFAHGFSAPLWLDEPQYLYRVPPELPPWAVLTEPLAVVEKGIHEALAVQRARLGGDAWRQAPPRVLVTGLGPIGFAAAAACLWRGWPTTVYGRDPEDSSRATLARELGADYLRDEAALAPSDVERDGFDLLLECTGSEEVLLQAARGVASCGVLVWLGSSRVPRPRPLNVGQLIRDGLLRNHIHIGTVNAAPRDFRSALAGLAAWRVSHGERLARLITARVPPSGALSHFANREPQGIKTVIQF